MYIAKCIFHVFILKMLIFKWLIPVFVFSHAYRTDTTVIGCSGFHGDCLTLTKIIDARLKVSCFWFHCGFKLPCFINNLSHLLEFTKFTKCCLIRWRRREKKIRHLFCFRHQSNTHKINWKYWIFFFKTFLV